jgi:hypothetical protein
MKWKISGVLIGVVYVVLAIFVTLPGSGSPPAKHTPHPAPTPITGPQAAYIDIGAPNDSVYLIGGWGSRTSTSDPTYACDLSNAPGSGLKPGKILDTTRRSQQKNGDAIVILDVQPGADVKIFFCVERDSPRGSTKNIWQITADTKTCKNYALGGDEQEIGAGPVTYYTATVSGSCITKKDDYITIDFSGQTTLGNAVWGIYYVQDVPVKSP